MKKWLILVPRMLLALMLPYTMTGHREFSAIHSNPPGIRTAEPSMIRVKVGKGQILYVAAPIERSQPLTSRRAVARIIRSLIDKPCLPHPTSRIPISPCAHLVETNEPLEVENTPDGAVHFGKNLSIRMLKVPCQGLQHMQTSSIMIPTIGKSGMLEA